MNEQERSRGAMCIWKRGVTIRRQRLGLFVLGSPFYVMALIRSFLSIVEKLNDIQLDTNATMDTNEKLQTPKRDRINNRRSNRLHRMTHHNNLFVTTSQHASLFSPYRGRFVAQVSVLGRLVFLWT